MNHTPMYFLLSGTVTVIEVHDGDTIKVKDNKDNITYTIRLVRIDAPEIKQAYGVEARDYLASLILNKEVKMLLKAGDFHGPRVDCEIYLIDGTNVNEQMVKNGCAWYYEFFDKGDIVMKQAQEYAQLNKLGLWGQSNPVAPWEYRKQQKENKK